MNNTLNTTKTKLGIWNAKCLYIHRNLLKMEKLLPEHYNIARGKTKRSLKVTKTPWVLKWWEKLQCMKKGTDLIVSLKLLVITAFEISSKLFFCQQNRYIFDLCLYYRSGNFLDSCKELLKLSVFFCLIKAVGLDSGLLQKLEQKMTDFLQQRKKI